MDNTTLINLTCPKCGAILELTPDTITIRCRYCKQEINTSDYINDTQSQITVSNRLDAYSDMAKNAVKTNDYASAVTYYRLICESSSDRSNVEKYNICCYLNNQIAFSPTLINDLSLLTNDEQLFFIMTIYNKLTDTVKDEIATATEYCITIDSRNQKRKEILSKYSKELLLISECCHKFNPDFKETKFTDSYTARPVKKHTFRKLIFSFIAIVGIFVLLYFIACLIN